MPLALFDIDGTLTASNEIDSVCFADAFRDVFGIEIDTNWGSYEHTTDRGIASEALRRSGRSPTDDLLATHRAKFIQLLDQRMTYLDEIPGARAFLAELLARDWRIALCTGAWSASARMKLSRARFDFDLPLASCDDDISREGILRRGIELAGGAGDMIVSFGDAPWDMRAAANLKLPFIGIGGRSGAAEGVKDFRETESLFATLIALVRIAK
ncbi:MAG TPA: HAD family hydrolase [Thermoanaerobaculia bacterium]|jgi:beta-phosphoglucomutase-like phosphatase (HAD superfamily)|nr:HAD family hydrolase [Thermoanaerobaculia bacterium]